MMIHRQQVLRVVLRDLVDERDLIRHVLERAQDNPVTLTEGVDVVGEAVLLTELPDEGLAPTQVVAGYTREQVVDDLELQAAVHEVHPLWAVHVHGSAELADDEGLVRTHVLHRHAKVGEGNLNVQRRGKAVGKENVGDLGLPVGEQGDKVRIPAEEKDHAGELEVPILGHGIVVEELEAEIVQIEAGEEHDDVIGQVLDPDEAFGGKVERHGSLKVGRVDVVKKASRKGEEGQVLNVGVILHVVRNNVMNVMAFLPPTDAQTSHEIAEEGPDEGVQLADMRDPVVPGIMGRKGDLVPEACEEDGSKEVVPCLCAVCGHIDGKREEVALEKAGGLDLGFELLEGFPELVVIPLGVFLAGLGVQSIGLLPGDGGQPLIGRQFTLVKQMNPLVIDFGRVHEINLIGRVPSVHMLDSELTSGVMLDPFGKVVYLFIINDENLATFDALG
ncbi:hypothetical protein BC937DRAFT_93142 [Endogone sp. FLAS-F59071]|nr:hypothetical protein BC937DRAFT_93142 [Endogone sp. FLAS-F59071]|eukprot:RUS14935.1 hypothetical protein BC937DRAFT_93142 [Endogone sp. FLAS-F59071]